MLPLLFAWAMAEAPTDTLPPATLAVYEQAEAAWKSGDALSAESLFARVNTEAPDFDRAWRRRCGATRELGRAAEAIELCRKAVALSPSVPNRTALAIALLSTDDEGQPDDGRPELGEARGLLDAVLTEAPDDRIAWAALCDWAVGVEDADTLRRCAPRLAALDPEGAGTAWYEAWVAFADARPADARTALTTARKRGLSDDLYEQLASRLGAEEQRPAKATEPAVVGLTDLVPWVIAAGLVLAVAALAFFGGKAEEPPA